MLAATASVGSGLVIFSGLLGDFQVQSDNPSQRLLVGGSDAYFPIHIRSISGFRGIVTMTATASPGANAILRGSGGPNPAVVLGTNDTDFLIVKVTTVGNYTVSVAGRSGILSHTINLSVLGEGLGISATQNPLVITRNSSGNTTLTMEGLNGLSGTLHVVCNGGCGVAFSSSPSVNYTLSLRAQSQVCSTEGCLSTLSRGGTVAVTLIATESGYSSSLTVPFSLLITIDWDLGFIVIYSMPINFS